MTTLNYNRNPT